MSILLLRDAHFFVLHTYKYLYILLQLVTHFFKDSGTVPTEHRRYLSNIVPKHAAFPDFVYAPISNCSRNSALRVSNKAPQLQLT